MFFRKYGVATNVYIPIIKRSVVDFAVSADWTPVAGDVKISKDGGAAANVTNLPTAITMGNAAMWNFSLTATELQAAKISIVVSDSSVKAVEDTQFNLITYGHASAELSGIDFTDVTRLGTTGLALDSDMATVLVRLSSARAGYLDNLSAGAVSLDSDVATVLSRLSSARAGYLDNLSAGAVSLNSDMATVLTRLSSTRAGYLDNLNVGGLVASAAGIAGITQAQRVRVMPPPLMERPDSGGAVDYRIWIYVYGPTHTAEDLDASPTVTAENNAGTDRSANLSAVTKPGGTTGQYYVDYSVAVAHAIEGIVIKVSAVEASVTTKYAAESIVVDTTAVDFTSADRTLLTTLATDYTTARAAKLDDITAIKTKTDNLPASPAATSDIPTANITAIKAKTDNLPASPAATGDIPTADISAIKLKTDNLPASPAATGDIPTASDNATGLLDLVDGVENNQTIRQAMRLILAVLVGKVSGGGSSTVTIRDTNDLVDRIVATVDGDGNRSSVTLDPS